MTCGAGPVRMGNSPDASMSRSPTTKPLGDVDDPLGEMREGFGLRGFQRMGIGSAGDMRHAIGVSINELQRCGVSGWNQDTSKVVHTVVQRKQC